MSRRQPVLVLLCCILSTSAFGQIAAPRLGLVRYSDSGVYAVTGVPGNYVVGKRLFADVSSLAFSDAGGMLFRNGTVVLLNEDAAVISTFETGASSAVVGIEKSLDSAVAWVASSRLLISWDGAALRSTLLSDLPGDGEVFQVKKTSADSAALLLRTTAGTVEEDLVSLTTGAVLSRSALPGSGVLFLADDATVSIQDRHLAITSGVTGTSRVVPIRANDLSFESMSTDCLHVHGAASARDWVLQLTGNQASLFELPPPQTSAVSSKGAR